MYLLSSPFKYGIIPGIYVKLRGVHPKIEQLPFVWHFVCCSFHPHCNTQTVIMSLVLDLMPLLLLRFAFCMCTTCIYILYVLLSICLLSTMTLSHFYMTIL